MRITVSHNKSPLEVRRSIDKSLDDIFTGLPIGPVQITDEKRTWNGSTMNFNFNARAAFMVVPISGIVIVEDHLVTLDVELPGFLNKLIPEEKMKSAVEGKVRGLLT